MKDACHFSGNPLGRERLDLRQRPFRHLERNGRRNFKTRGDCRVLLTGRTRDHVSSGPRTLRLGHRLSSRLASLIYLSENSRSPEHRRSCGRLGEFGIEPGAEDAKPRKVLGHDVHRTFVLTHVEDQT
jgi:hypothetical protein